MSVRCTCKNDIWEVIGDLAYCTNCRFERPYIRRNPTGEITPSQQAAVDRIVAFFKREGKVPVLCRQDVERVTDGLISLSVATTDSVWSVKGGHFFIGYRGGVEIIDCYDLYDTQQCKLYYAHMLKARIGK